MGYRGKVAEQDRCRDLRAEGWTYNEIAAEVGVSKSSVSLWCRDVEPDPEAWASRAGANRARGWLVRRPHPQHVAKEAEIARLQAEGRERIASLTEREFLIAGLALYAGEGSKRDGGVRMANCDPRILYYFVTWLRRCFTIDDARLRVRMYLHVGLDLDHANAFWSDLLAIPLSQFTVPYRAESRVGVQHTKHVLGCPSVVYSSTSVHREVTGLMDALLSLPQIIPG
jgi:hypothetical protein